MDYTPWPEVGCSLAEARKRTADRVLASRLARSHSNNKDVETQSVEEQIDGECLELLKSGRLIAYGRSDDLNADLQRIRSESWSTVSGIEWQISSAEFGGTGEIALADVRVYPPLLAPCRSDSLEGSTLAEAFGQFVLGDPEVKVLGADAVRLAPDFKAVFGWGRCQVHGAEEWPIAFERWGMVNTVHPDPQKRSKFDNGRVPDPLEVVIAVEALKHRYCVLISILRRGDVEGHGLPFVQGHPNLIPRSVWSHEEFWLRMNTGDVLQDNRDSRSRVDRLSKRWSGVVLQSRATANRHVKTNEVFHGKPLTYQGLPWSTSEPPDNRSRSLRATSRVEAKMKSRKDCEAWLREVMERSPADRVWSKSELWEQAQKKWPGTLTLRQFIAARSDAISATNAFAWGAGGAPRRPQHRNRRTK
ncbi:hypothetical protein [Bradyrhizobium cosmicum]|uniref:hypothetical protein n=1 Tax=Bradyrhizobium cosmicum TaxID=1404864 RepID=UPI001181A65C|nr:hypothetical protein [Bradyrhizobium cosmicum]